MSSPSVSTPQINYTNQLKQTLAGYKATSPGYFDLNSTYAPKYTDLNLNTMKQTLFGDANAPGQLQTQARANAFNQQQQIAANTRARTADISDIANLGPAGYAALMRSNPGLAQSLTMANRAGAQSVAPGSLLSQLQSTAQQQLALGDRLSPQEANAITQSTRSGFADRGIVGGNQALGAELLARDQYANQRMAQRIGFANTVQGDISQNNNYLNSLASLNAGIYDPSQQVLGRGGSPLSSLGGGGTGTLAAMAGQNNFTSGLSAANLFNPNAGADTYNTGVNAQGASDIANANNSAARTNGLIAGGASIAASVAIAL